MKKQYLDYAGLKRVLKRLLPGARKIWHGTLEEWESLSETERDKYDQAEVIDGSDNILITEYVRNQNILSNYENITLGTSAATATTMKYDGFIMFTKSNTTVTNIYVNDTVVANINNVPGTGIAANIPVRKGDVVYITSQQGTDIVKARFYKLRDYTGR